MTCSFHSMHTILSTLDLSPLFLLFTSLPLSSPSPPSSSFSLLHPSSLFSLSFLLPLSFSFFLLPSLILPLIPSSPSLQLSVAQIFHLLTMDRWSSVAPHSVPPQSTAVTEDSSLWEVARVSARWMEHGQERCPAVLVREHRICY